MAWYWLLIAGGVGFVIGVTSQASRRAAVFLSSSRSRCPFTQFLVPLKMGSSGSATEILDDTNTVCIKVYANDVAEPSYKHTMSKGRAEQIIKIINQQEDNK